MRCRRITVYIIIPISFVIFSLVAYIIDNKILNYISVGITVLYSIIVILVTAREKFIEHNNSPQPIYPSEYDGDPMSYIHSNGIGCLWNNLARIIGEPNKYDNPIRFKNEQIELDNRERLKGRLPSQKFDMNPNIQSLPRQNEYIVSVGEPPQVNFHYAPDG